MGRPTPYVTARRLANAAQRLGHNMIKEDGDALSLSTLAYDLARELDALAVQLEPVGATTCTGCGRGKPGRRSPGDWTCPRCKSDEHDHRQQPLPLEHRSATTAKGE